MKLQGHNFHFSFSSTCPDKVWMWHEMRCGSRANWYLINARPDWLICCMSHPICMIYKWASCHSKLSTQYRASMWKGLSNTGSITSGKKNCGATLCKSSQTLHRLCHCAIYFMHKSRAYLRALNATKCQNNSECFVWSLYICLGIVSKRLSFHLKYLQAAQSINTFASLWGTALRRTPLCFKHPILFTGNDAAWAKFPVSAFTPTQPQKLLFYVSNSSSTSNMKRLTATSLISRMFGLFAQFSVSRLHQIE